MNIVEIIRWAIFITFIAQIIFGTTCLVWLFILDKRTRERVIDVDSRLTLLERGPCGHHSDSVDS